MSNVVKRFQNVQSKYAKFNPAKAAVLSAAGTGNNGSPEGSISEAGSRTPTSALGVDFQAAILAQNIEKGKIPLLLAVEAGNQSMCRELLSAQTADQLKVSKAQPFISQNK
ncbi:uncharacterized protein LOC120432110 [Culex pipiens pallens]|uniref:uncharacterized protein LOC120432110 n=1 Tax=Culex pipiens pallens TaxID=42434 RepID=UPI001952A3EC|nr:uncharacterized protein LOC120432110 [Culex pipiens pallens]